MTRLHLAGIMPEGGSVLPIQTKTGPLRAAYWLSHEKDRPAQGTVFIFQGRAEYIEKYAPLITAWRERAYAVAVFDWRGQGGSVRLLDNPRKGHIGCFSSYQGDLDAVLGTSEFARLPKPWTLMAHSMGGCIGLQRLYDQPELFRQAIFTAPMLGFPLPWHTDMLSYPMSHFMVMLGRSDAYITNCDDQTLADRPFEGNMLTSDESLYAEQVAFLRENKSLALGGPTWGWLLAALKAMSALKKQKKPLTVPSLCFLAEHDTIIDNAAAQDLAQKETLFQTIMLKNSRHEPLKERPEIQRQIWQKIDSFLIESIR